MDHRHWKQKDGEVGGDINGDEHQVTHFQVPALQLAGFCPVVEGTRAHDQGVEKTLERPADAEDEESRDRYAEGARDGEDVNEGEAKAALYQADDKAMEGSASEDQLMEERRIG
ncbi:MAG: hypothetical protein M1816_004255 [Peltula sp. TS41687]|nr:MAG: hypothetical protein M1816_004255 [Peltula sp. TS41687]